MKWLKLFSGKTKEIASQAPDAKLICWQFRSSNPLDATATVVVKEDQLVLIIRQQKIAAILEQGEHPLNYVFEDLIDEKDRSALGRSALSNTGGAIRGDINDINDIKLYYFTVKTFTDQRWGTAAPIALHDVKLGSILLRAHGTFSYKLGNPKKLWRHLDSNLEQIKTDDIIGNLRSLILSTFSSLVNNVPDLSQLLKNQEAFSKQVLDNLKPEFSNQGLQLEKFLIQSLSFVEKT